MKKLPKRRANLLLELEKIVGNECYNANIQNWGPHGVFLGEGRGFRYPINFTDQDGNTIKRKYVGPDIPVQTLASGYYAFGANELYIIRALDKVLSHLEQEYDLKF